MDLWTHFYLKDASEVWGGDTASVQKKVMNIAASTNSSTEVSHHLGKPIHSFLPLKD